METPMRLEGKVAIVTGSSRGVGRAVAMALAREGCDLVLAAKSLEPHAKLEGHLGEVAAEIRRLGRKALPIATDVRHTGEIDAMVARAHGELGRIDILVNNAGAAWWHDIGDTPEKRFDLVMNVNCKGPFFACRAVLPHMLANAQGHIVNMSPPIRPEMAEGRIAYMISKLGMSMLTVGLAAELTSAGANIAVNSLWPVTMIESAATRHLGLGQPEDWRKADILADATVAIVTTPPAERTGQTLLDEDVLRAVGITDFATYALVPGATPRRIPW